MPSRYGSSGSASRPRSHLPRRRRLEVVARGTGERPLRRCGVGGGFETAAGRFSDGYLANLGQALERLAERGVARLDKTHLIARRGDDVVRLFFADASSVAFAAGRANSASARETVMVPSVACSGHGDVAIVPMLNPAAVTVADIFCADAPREFDARDGLQSRHRRRRVAERSLSYLPAAERVRPTFEAAGRLRVSQARRSRRGSAPEARRAHPCRGYRG